MYLSSTHRALASKPRHLKVLDEYPPGYYFRHPARARTLPPPSPSSLSRSQSRSGALYALFGRHRNPPLMCSPSSSSPRMCFGPEQQQQRCRASSSVACAAHSLCVSGSAPILSTFSVSSFVSLFCHCVSLCLCLFLLVFPSLLVACLYFDPTCFFDIWCLLGFPSTSLFCFPSPTWLPAFSFGDGVKFRAGRGGGVAVGFMRCVSCVFLSRDKGDFVAILVLLRRIF